MKSIFTLIFSLVISASAFASTSKAVDPLRPLKDTLAKIQKAKMIDYRLEKKVTSELMESEKTYVGRAYLSGSLFRFETQTPEKSLVVFDGNTLWIAQYPDADFGGPIQVLKGKAGGKQKEQLVMTELLTRGKLLESFTIKKTGEENGIYSFEGEPKDKSLNLKKVRVKVDGKKGQLKFLEYVDDVGNKTALTVTDQKLLSKRQSELFRYKPEKGAQVSDL